MNDLVGLQQLDQAAKLKVDVRDYAKRTPLVYAARYDRPDAA